MPEIIHPGLEGVYTQVRPNFKEGRAPMVTLIDGTEDQNHPLTTKSMLKFIGIQVNADYSVHTKMESRDRVSVDITWRKWAIHLFCSRTPVSWYHRKELPKLDIGLF